LREPFEVLRLVRLDALTAVDAETGVFPPQGQIKGVKRMIEEGEYCIDIITHIQVAHAALMSVNKAIPEKHLKHCVADALTEKNEQEIGLELEEIMTVIKRMQK
jgi:DNA-binding FrmR family transcriptional regulator